LWKRARSEILTLAARGGEERQAVWLLLQARDSLDKTGDHGFPEREREEQAWGVEVRDGFEEKRPT
jgi:hypothetical protein